MKAAIVIDNWKLPIFDRHLTEAGFTYEKKPGVTKDTVTLRVETENALKLKDVVIAANNEAARVHTAQVPPGTTFH